MSIVPLSPWLAHRPRRGVVAVDTAILHSCDLPDAESLVHDLRLHDRSFHYIIERDGAVYKGVPFGAVAFHCGNSYGPHEAARGVSGERDATGAFVDHPCVNEYSLGICLMHDDAAGEDFPREQISACAQLLKDLKSPLPKLTYLTTHAYVSPGRSNDLQDFDVNAIARACELTVWRLEPVPA